MLARRPKMSGEIQTGGGVGLPTRVIVSLRAGFVLALANIVCVAILGWAWVHAKSPAKEISVTGSARKKIESDLIVWRTDVVVRNENLVKAYEELNQGVEKTLAFLKTQGVDHSEITVQSISTSKHMQKNEKGVDTDKISSYELTQIIEVTSGRVREVASVERTITRLIKEGILLDSHRPLYFYTKLADLKVAMLAEATKDAAARAQQIASNSGATLGTVREARMGVMQINAQHSDEASASGVNDTGSFVKEITAVVSARFALE
jgi:uncharacterized protein